MAFYEHFESKQGILEASLDSSRAQLAAAVVPLLTFIALAPLVGAERAREVANGDGRARGSPG